jgi:hypothetical protein
MKGTGPMKRLCVLIVALSLVLLPSCKDADITKSLQRGIDILDVVTKSLQDAEAKQLIAPGGNVEYYAFIERTKTNLTQAKTVAGSVAALGPDERKNVLTILSTVRSGLNDLDMSGIKEPGVKKKVQAGFLAFGTGIDALKIALQE